MDFFHTDSFACAAGGMSSSKECVSNPAQTNSVTLSILATTNSDSPFQKLTIANQYLCLNPCTTESPFLYQDGQRDTVCLAPFQLRISDVLQYCENICQPDGNCSTSREFERLTNAIIEILSLSILILIFALPWFKRDQIKFSTVTFSIGLVIISQCLMVILSCQGYAEPRVIRTIKIKHEKKHQAKDQLSFSSANQITTRSTNPSISPILSTSNN